MICEKRLSDISSLTYLVFGRSVTSRMFCVLWQLLVSVVIFALVIAIGYVYCVYVCLCLVNNVTEHHQYYGKG